MTGTQTDISTGQALKVIYEAVASHQPDGDKGAMARIIKIGEELGEVSDAFLGCRGFNKRKGVTNPENKVADELCDVAVTALVALRDWSDNPDAVFAEAVQRIARRCGTEGS